MVQALRLEVMGALSGRNSWFGAILTCFILLSTLQGSSYALDVTLAWEANKESNLAGYIVYYDTDSGPPYTPESNDYAIQYSIDGETTWSDFPAAPPIWVGPGTTEITLKLPDGKNYFFAVRAFDALGNVSAYSREVCAIAPENIDDPYTRGWAITRGELKGFKIFYSTEQDPGMTPTLGRPEDIPPFNLPGLTGLGIPLNFQPSGAVFNVPLWIEFPCPGYSGLDEISLGLYDDSKWVLVWDGEAGQLTSAGEEWLEGEPQYNTDENPHTISILVKHFSGVQAAAPTTALSVTVQSGGGGGCFISALGVK